MVTFSSAFENNQPSWSHDGRWIYFSSNRTGRIEIWKVPADGGEERQVTRHGGIAAFESPDGKTLFYSKGLPGEIWKTPTTGGLEERVDAQLNNIEWGNWAITSKGIYFLRQVGSQGAYIGFYDFGLRRVIRVGSTNKPVDVGQSNLSVSPDGRWLLYSEIDQLVSDIMLVKNFR
jgi:Tol biopolymer transport system component